MVALELDWSVAEVNRAFRNERLDLSKIASIASVDEALEEYRHSLPGNRSCKLILQRWIAICRNTRQLEEVWKLAKQDITGDTRTHFIEKWLNVAENPKEGKSLGIFFHPLERSEKKLIVEKTRELIQKAQKRPKKK